MPTSNKTVLAPTSDKAIMMTDIELRRMKRELDEIIALRSNLVATQNRCNELLEASRSQGRRIKVLEAEIEILREALAPVIDR